MAHTRGDIRLRFWGVRGSIPCPGPETVKYGGNTACLELRFGEEERLIIIDAGSGIRELGNYLMKHDLPKGAIKTKIYLTHTHWDHIMGFPFFTPNFILLLSRQLPFTNRIFIIARRIRALSEYISKGFSIISGADNLALILETVSQDQDRMIQEFCSHPETIPQVKGALF
ncbi:hypothetical protein ES708_05703 [subsurface metagenome]